MNDRFKFRYWHKGRKEYIKTECDCLALCNNCFHSIKDVQTISGWYNTMLEQVYNSFDLIPEQCTGVKDKNGNLIYEGDIVEITIFGSVGPNGGYVDSDEIYKGTVVWDRDCFLVKTDTDDMILFSHSEDCIEIIGNIHEQEEQKE